MRDYEPSEAPVVLVLREQVVTCRREHACDGCPEGGRIPAGEQAWITVALDDGEFRTWKQCRDRACHVREGERELAAMAAETARRLASRTGAPLRVLRRGCYSDGTMVQVTPALRDAMGEWLARHA